jgi:hypothetical protein
MHPLEMEDTDLHRRPALPWLTAPFIVDAPMNSRIFFKAEGYEVG